MSAVAAILGGTAGHARAPLGPHSHRHLDCRRASRSPISCCRTRCAPGLHGLVNALSKGCASQGITVNAVMPGYTLTERLIEVGVTEAEIASRIPRRTHGQPVEFAALAAFRHPIAPATSPARRLPATAVCCNRSSGPTALDGAPAKPRLSKKARTAGMCCWVRASLFVIMTASAACWPAEMP